MLTNALKYAFSDRQEGEIYLKLKEDDGQLKINIKDNGVGIVEDTERSDSFGHRLIGMLLDQLDGSITTQNNQGTQIDIVINKYEKAA